MKKYKFLSYFFLFVSFFGLIHGVNAEIAKIREDVLAMELKLTIGGPLNFKLTSSTTDQPETELMKKFVFNLFRS